MVVSPAPGLKVLGPLRLTVAGREVTPLARSRRLVLAILACKANQSVAVDLLIDAVWHGRLPKTPRKALQILLHRMRGLLGDVAHITCLGEGYELAPRHGDLDATVFTSSVERARVLLSQGHMVEADRCFQDALSLWRGPVLTEFSDVTVIADQAEELEQVRLTAAEQSVALGLAMGRARELVPTMSRLVRSYPLAERLREQLMVTLYAAGRRTDALAAYQSARHELTTELGVEPGEGLRRVRQHILHEAPVDSLLLPLAARIR